jgi:maltose alpha-D-glucosyltransferase/alpha-amylase
MPADPAAARALLDFFTLEKAVYEVDYELSQRPQWAIVPLAGVLGLLEGESGDGAA